MTSQVAISKIDCMLSANQKIDSEFNVYELSITRKGVFSNPLLDLVWLIGNTQLISLCFMNSYQLFPEHLSPQFFFLPKGVSAR